MDIKNLSPTGSGRGPGAMAWVDGKVDPEEMATGQYDSEGKEEVLRGLLFGIRGAFPM